MKRFPATGFLMFQSVKWKFMVAFCAGFALAVGLWAGDCACAADYFQQVEIPSSLNPVGSGARALGMGGAFIAVADDATAASWNPGGLIQLERPEISFVMDGFHRIEDNSFGTDPGSNGDETVSQVGINYFSISYPFVLFERNMIVSLNYQDLYNFSRKWDFQLESSVDRLSVLDRIDYRQDGKLSAVGLAWCVQIVPSLSFGFTLNVWDDDLTDNNWEQTTIQNGSGTQGGEPFTSRSRLRDQYAFSGVNANFGVLWRVGKNWTIGAVVKTPFEADLKHRHEFESEITYPALPEFGTKNANSFVEDETLTMPMSYGIGLSYLFPSRNFTLSFDVYRTQWDDFILEDAEGRKTSAVTGKPSSESHVDPTHQVRLGAEYLFLQSKYKASISGGVFYDPAPAEGSPDDVYGFSMGTGFGVGPFNVNVAYQYRFGNNVGAFMMQARDYSMDLKEHVVYSSVIWHF